MTKIVRWALCMAAGLASVGIASAQEGAAPLDPVQVEARRAYANRLLLDKLGDQTYLVQLEKEFRLAQELEGALRTLRQQILMAVQSGSLSQVEVDIATAALAEAQIGGQAAAAALQAGRLRYLARFGAAFDTAAKALPWAERWPQEETGFLAAVADADRAEAQIAWGRAQRARTVVGLQQTRVQALVEVVKADERRFAVGRTSLESLLAAHRAARRAQGDLAAAEREVRLAQAAVVSGMGRLDESDLAPVARRGWAVDPDAPGRADPPAPPAKPAKPAKPVTGTSGQVKPRPADDPLVVGEMPRVDPAPAAAASGPLPSGDWAANEGQPPGKACPDDPPGLPTARIHGLPVFDPGPPSSEEKIPHRLLRADSGATTLGDVARRMVAALDEARYEYSFLAVGTQGFALVTRMEQFRPDGAPSPARWSREPPRVGELGLMEFIQALFRAPPGQYRVIALVVSDEARERGGADRGEGRFDALFDCGANRLPQALAVVPFTANTRADALVYEFAKPSANARASLVEHPRRDAHFHLVKAGIWDALNGE
ncbi:MAG: hypothetical protein JNM61_12700 [Zoogloeaceae bacterium]|nr:hypothetical protein [Zoogloeaceae bacterium]